MNQGRGARVHPSNYTPFRKFVTIWCLENNMTLKDLSQKMNFDLGLLCRTLNHHDSVSTPLFNKILSITNPSEEQQEIFSRAHDTAIIKQRQKLNISQLNPEIRSHIMMIAACSYSLTDTAKNKLAAFVEQYCQI